MQIAPLCGRKCVWLTVKTISGRNLKETGIHFEVTPAENGCDKECVPVRMRTRACVCVWADSAEQLSTTVQIGDAAAVMKISGRVSDLEHQQQI